MNHFDPIINILYEDGIDRIFIMVILMITRTMGLLYGFIIVTFSLAQMRLARISIAFAISLPLWVSNVSAIENIINNQNDLIAMSIIVKEFMIGYSLGFLASLPFFAIKYAAAITDQVRGESNPSFQSGNGEQLSSFALLYTITAFLIFMFSDSFILILSALYKSYEIWPLDSFLPGFNKAAGMVALEALSDTLYLAIKITVPLLSVLLLVEVACGVSGRIAKRISFYNLAFIVKNTVTLFCLPIMLTVFFEFFESIFLSAVNTLELMGAFLK